MSDMSVLLSVLSCSLILRLPLLQVLYLLLFSDTGNCYLVLNLF